MSSPPPHHHTARRTAAVACHHRRTSWRASHPGSFSRSREEDPRAATWIPSAPLPLRRSHVLDAAVVAPPPSPSSVIPAVSHSSAIPRRGDLALVLSRGFCRVAPWHVTRRPHRRTTAHMFCLMATVGLRLVFYYIQSTVLPPA